MAEKKSKEEKQKEKAEKKALKQEAKEAKKKAKLEKKDGKKTQDPDDKREEPKSKKGFFSFKKIIILIAALLILIGSGFVGYKYFFSNSEEPIIYNSVALKNVNLPDEMLRFSFNKINDLYYALVTYNLRIFLMDKEINRINKIGDDYPDQKSIAFKEKKNWVTAKKKVVKVFSKIEKTIKEIYVLYNVNKENGEQKINEISKELLAQANEALKTLDTYIEKIEVNKEKELEGFINQSLFKMKRLFK